MATAATATAGSRAAALLVLLLSLALRASGAGSGAGGDCHFPAVFNFGDSNSDTGGLSSLFGAAPPPNGRTFFGMPAGRYCDGRLVIDFIECQLYFSIGPARAGSARHDIGPCWAGPHRAASGRRALQAVPDRVSFPADGPGTAHGSEFVPGQPAKHAMANRPCQHEAHDREGEGSNVAAASMQAEEVLPRRCTPPPVLELGAGGRGGGWGGPAEHGRRPRR